MEQKQTGANGNEDLALKAAVLWQSLGRHFMGLARELVSNANREAPGSIQLPTVPFCRSCSSVLIAGRTAQFRLRRPSKPRKGSRNTMVRCKGD